MSLLYLLPLSLTINIDISKGQTAYSSIKPHVKGGLHHAKNRIHPVVYLPDRSVHRSVFQHLPFHQKYRGPLRTTAHRDHHIQNRLPAKFSHLASHEFHAVFSHAPGIAEPLSLPPSATRSLVQELRHRLLQRARLDGSTLSRPPVLSSSYPAAEPLPDPRLFPVRPGSPILLSAKLPPPIRCRQAFCRKFRAPDSFRRPPQCSRRIFPCKKQPAHKGQTASITDYFFLASGRRIPYGSSSSPSCSFAIIRAAMVFASIISPRAAI